MKKILLIVFCISPYVLSDFEIGILEAMNQ